MILIAFMKRHLKRSNFSSSKPRFYGFITSNINYTIKDIKRWDNRIRLAKKGGWDTRIRLAKKLVTDWDKRIRLAKKSRLRLMKKDWDTRIRLAKKSSSSSSGQEDYDEAYQIKEENNALFEGGDDKRSGHIRLI